jgi:hypothetical protein
MQAGSPILCQTVGQILSSAIWGVKLSQSLADLSALSIDAPSDETDCRMAEFINVHYSFPLQTGASGASFLKIPRAGISFLAGGAFEATGCTR